MVGVRWTGLLLLLASLGISALLGISIGRSFDGGSVDLQGIYYATKCMIQHRDPYKLAELKAVYELEAKKIPSGSITPSQFVAPCNNLPSTFLLMTPLALLTWTEASTLWVVFLLGGLFVASMLTVQAGARYAPNVSVFLACALLMNCEVGIALANAGVIVVSLCTIGAWSLIRDKFAFVGQLCLAIGLSIKPHDVFPVLAYFVLARAARRMHALKALGMATAIGLAATGWTAQVAPHWMQEWHSNVSALSMRGSLNDPGPSAPWGRGAGQVIDLHAAVSVVEDDPRIYDPVTYAVCGGLLLVWAFTALRARCSEAGPWLALASVVPLALLVTYHRPYDAKLLLLTIPACAKLWSEAGRTGKAALGLTAAAIGLTADIPLVVLSKLGANLSTSNASFFERVLTAAVLRPTPLVLLAMAVFYLWVYVRHSRVDGTTTCRSELNSGDPQIALDEHLRSQTPIRARYTGRL
jgi:hypothetical protein